MLSGQIVRFPDDFKIRPEAKIDDFPRVIASANPNLAKFLSQSWPDKWQYIEIGKGKNTVYVALRDWDIYPEPKASPSKGSNAIYYAEKENCGFGFLLKWLPPYSKTSNHWHEKRREFYYLIAGQAEVIVRGNPCKLDIEGKSQLMIETSTDAKGFHPVITRRRPSLMVVQMEGGLDRSDHHY